MNLNDHPLREWDHNGKFTMEDVYQDRPPQEWLVPNFIPQPCLGMNAGNSGSLKSFSFAHAAM